MMSAAILQPAIPFETEFIIKRKRTMLKKKRIFDWHPTKDTSAVEQIEELGKKYRDESQTFRQQKYETMIYLYRLGKTFKKDPSAADQIKHHRLIKDGYETKQRSIFSSIAVIVLNASSCRKRELAMKWGRILHDFCLNELSDDQAWEQLRKRGIQKLYQKLKEERSDVTVKTKPKAQPDTEGNLDDDQEDNGQEDDNNSDEDREGIGDKRKDQEDNDDDDDQEDDTPAGLEKKSRRFTLRDYLMVGGDEALRGQLLKRSGLYQMLTKVRHNPDGSFELTPLKVKRQD